MFVTWNLEREIVYRWLSFILAKEFPKNSEDLPAITNDFLFHLLFAFSFFLWDSLVFLTVEDEIYEQPLAKRIKEKKREGKEN